LSICILRLSVKSVAKLSFKVMVKILFANFSKEQFFKILATTGVRVNDFTKLSKPSLLLRFIFVV
jgi:hypothetical protein